MVLRLVVYLLHLVVNIIPETIESAHAKVSVRFVWIVDAFGVLHSTLDRHALDLVSSRLTRKELFAPLIL